MSNEDLLRRLRMHSIDHKDDPDCRLCLIVRSVEDADRDALERLLGMLGEGEWVNREQVATEPAKQVHRGRDAIG